MEKRLGEKATNWKGGITIHSYKNHDKKYFKEYNPHHPNNNFTYVFSHVLIVESVLNKYLPKGVVIHHINGDGLDNRNENLVVCENGSYHNLLHQRMIAIENCGHVTWRKCGICKEYDSPENMFKKKAHLYHRDCWNRYERERYHRNGDK